MNRRIALISVIVPVYNAGDFLISCLESLAAQTYQNLEILLIDDGSTDGSGERCEEYAAKDSRFKVIHKENGGVSSARNLGLDLAQGEYIAFVDADDLIEKNYFATLCQDMIQNRADIVFCGFRVVDDCGNPVEWPARVKKNRLITDKDELMQDIVDQKEGYFSAVWGSLISKDLTHNVRFQSLRYGEDGLFVFDVLCSGPTVYLDSYPGYIYIRQPNSVTVAVKDPFRRAKDLLYLWSRKYLHIASTSLGKQHSLLLPYASLFHTVAYMAAQSENRCEYAAVSDLLKEHLQHLLPMRNKLPPKLRAYILLYAKAPWLYKILSQLHKKIRG